MKTILSMMMVALLVFGCVQGTPQTTANTTQEEPVSTAQNGDTVRVDYIGTLEDGTVFDTSLKNIAQANGFPARPSYQPLEFKVGGGSMIAGFDKGVIGMKEGEEKTINIPASEAYGEARADRIIQVPVEQIGGGNEVMPGAMIQTNQGYKGVVTKIEDGIATIDFNHELAGKALTFRIFMRSIVKSG